MTPTEQARKDVEGWFCGDLKMKPYGSWRSYLDRLIARLTPVYAKAAEYDRLSKR